MKKVLAVIAFCTLIGNFSFCQYYYSFFSSQWHFQIEVPSAYLKIENIDANTPVKFVKVDNSNNIIVAMFVTAYEENSNLSVSEDCDTILYALKKSYPNFQKISDSPSWQNGVQGRRIEYKLDNDVICLAHFYKLNGIVYMVKGCATSDDFYKNEADISIAAYSFREYNP